MTCHNFFQCILPRAARPLFRGRRLGLKRHPELEGKSANLLIQPKTDEFDGSDFSARKEMIEAGYLAGQAAIPELRRRLGLA